MEMSGQTPQRPSERLSSPGLAASENGAAAGAAKSDIHRLLEAVIQYGGSDLHLTVGRPPVVRVNGSLHNLGKNTLTPDDTIRLMKSVTPEEYQRELAEQGGADFGMPYKDVARFRVSIYRQKGCVGMVMRLIPSRLRSFEELGLPPVVKEVCLRPRGLVLVTGPTGSGKTSTLATMIDYINTERADHIVTIEDPIEYYHQHKKCVITQRELGKDVPSFPVALRRALRMDPDVVLVGEMRDLETISTAITAAETGHLVMATLHTTGAAETVNRIVDAFPPDQQNQVRAQLAATLVGVISQALLPTADRKGRVAAFELMFTNDSIRNLLIKGETNKINSYIQTGHKEGMVLLDDYLFNLWRLKKISANDMMRTSQDPLTLERKMKEYAQANK